MRVCLQRSAFFNDAYHHVGDIITLPAGAAIAPFMKALSDASSPTPRSSLVAVREAAPLAMHDKTVTVHYRQDAHEVDIDVNGVEMRVDHAALKLQVD